MSDLNLNENTQESEKQVPQDEAIVAPSSPTPSKFSKGLVEQVELVVIAFAAIILLFSFFMRTCEVSGDSMENTLIGGDTVLISNLFYEPERGDVIVFHNTNSELEDLNEPMVKRVIGLPGDTVKIEYSSQGNGNKGEMKVTVIYPDGTEHVLDEDYIKYEYKYGDINKSFSVGEGKLFVMGDHRTVSLDSRYPNIGLVDSRRVLGKVLLRLNPSKFGKVD